MTSQSIDITAAAFRNAVVRIQKRAEKQTDWQRLEEVFVKTDLWDRVHSNDAQLVLGRRGTGKTHLLRVFQKDVSAAGDVALYIDCTSLGSGLTGDPGSEVTIAKKYFVAIVNQIGTDLLDHALRMELPNGDQQEHLISHLAHGLTLEAGQGTDRGIPSFNYRQLHDSMKRILELMDVSRIYIILDEWAQIPFSAQPYVAEFVKRGIASVPGVCLKLLAVNYQCELSKQLGNERVGLQRGADLPDVVDMDRYLVYDEKREYVLQVFGKLLYNHIGVELSWDLSATAASKQRQVERLFTQQSAFVELVRAAEGNPRDFLCIFSRAYFDEFRQSSTRMISIPNVTKAAESWYDTEKSANVNADQRAVDTLAHLMNTVLKGYKSRTFLVETTKADAETLRRLLNERVLHKLNGTYSHKDRPGVRYDLFTVDYGAYVRFRNTSSEVKELVFWEDDDLGNLDDEAREARVPVDDRRSIRRITFDPDSLCVEGDFQTAGLQNVQK